MKAPPQGWPRISATLFYQDPRAAIDWLCKAFDFELRLLVETGDGGVAHSELVYGDDGVIMIAQAGGRHKGQDPKANGHTGALMVYVDDVDAHCKKARELGATITTEPMVSDYGEDYWADRSYGVTDPHGHHWWFVQRLSSGKLDWTKVRQKVDRNDDKGA